MIYIGADHRGFEFKEKIKTWLTENEFDYEDVGAFELNLDDSFVDFAELVAEKIVNFDDRGIIICGSGVGVDVVANRHENVRSGLAIDVDQIRSAREDDDINILALAADHTPEVEILDIVSTFLNTDFSSEEKYHDRVSQLNTIHD
ncbi:MAG: hypothetical protein UW46_C0011G0014 [Candidatus Yanofskybacteria bacterium GW2011_GWF1_44_227]|uniref:Ribose-5-phosphate isomerase n=1 Tax=Candidatus Yanofskybacteria bacterium GW2011_GWE2_40_11 TaxID=1619033 RepID=A0A0G0QJI1_9BACT|nr:MAG: hypothetical protein UT69_C0007G0012 [Candidatus Yanofskybacteria bacterium GW2011_GWE1_40_10]KKR40524.1 MAG: hypothetical protein UT75_C0008G0046 [Candidatus Yanofskybacteria bacterium GW2011_GWE2_40_11]KKT14678.1 MAG: hypothetical protein UV97_C0017G0003 [Candidatus Yanofskybacteria bacterium GW2011_GWF2_43_596]KKT52792.1 MAG: hypothetical protein UW46_C0011G0014 [Candidatus Yanofskybacteria bacterium GW2011_GWF1_44_227]OGN35478.1 MAG: hypothetical protein A2207_01935 [Candidatus Yano